MALIPVNNVKWRGAMVATTVYDTDSNAFSEVGYRGLTLPIAGEPDAASSVRGGGCSLLGICGERFVVSFGESRALLIDRRSLRRNGVNYTVDDADNIQSLYGEIADLSKFFSDDSFVYVRDMYDSGEGVSKRTFRFLGYDIRSKKAGIIKLDKPEVLRNELCYKIIGDTLSIPVCPVEPGRACGGKPAIISFVALYPESDGIISFYKLAHAKKLSLTELVDSMSDQFRIDFYRALILDYIMEQADRNLSNLAVLDGSRLHPLFDNGAALGSAASSGGYSDSFANAARRLPSDMIEATLSNLYKAREALPADVFERVRRNADRLLHPA